ncbi:MAG: transporter [Acidimicrobiales bacterium]|nr:transporter [Acidimicrobiales bacterium]
MAQAIDSVKHAFHVSDAVMGAVLFLGGAVGAVGALWIAHLCARYRRTMVLAGMFIVWGLFMGLVGTARDIRVGGLHLSGFIPFIAFFLVVSLAQATDPAALPLIADWWSVKKRAAKLSVFNAGAGIGSFIGLAVAGVLIDNVGWRWVFYFWVPFGFLAAALIATRAEPERGTQDAEYADDLARVDHEAAELERADENLVIDLVAQAGLGLDIEPVTGMIDPATAGNWEVARHILRIRSWRLVCLGIGVSQIVLNALLIFGISYFKRTFHLSGTEVAGLAPVIGGGSFVGLLCGGFLADRLLLRGIVRARVYVTAVGYIVAGCLLMLAFTSQSLPVAAVLIGLGSVSAAVPIGPQWALLLDVVPARLRSQSSAVADIVQFVSALGYPIVGGLSTLFGENLRLAFLCVSPVYVLGGLLVLAARKTYVADVALVVAEARTGAGVIRATE